MTVKPKSPTVLTARCAASDRTYFSSDQLKSHRMAPAGPRLSLLLLHEISSLRPDQLVFIDETGLDRSVGTRRKGWTLRGKRPRQTKRFHRSRMFQILSAYNQDGVIHFRVYEGSTDSRVFEDFIEELLPYCGKWPNPRSSLIMDNASFHHSKIMQQLCDDAGLILRYLLLYSPDLNPIEGFFRGLKIYIRHVWHEHEGFIKADFLSFSEECVTVVDAREASAKAYFCRAGISTDENRIKWNTCYFKEHAIVSAARCHTFVQHVRAPATL